ncbi:Hypothetical predicted protein [Olea europaea subsp. europaea]|uniref:Uncharacterized protein n=1 Tax=Olea europaea subsp. europaea TaxID=158383 RepID=A0A8S0SA37_OLEEU|nr:Hypothetical predicted protein [Olea europaea subsp. europaea]
MSLSTFDPTKLTFTANICHHHQQPLPQYSSLLLDPPLPLDLPASPTTATPIHSVRRLCNHSTIHHNRHPIQCAKRLYHRSTITIANCYKDEVAVAAKHLSISGTGDRQIAIDNSVQNSRTLLRRLVVKTR